jgi:hypothetical protein
LVCPQFFDLIIEESWRVSLSIAFNHYHHLIVKVCNNKQQIHRLILNYIWFIKFHRLYL